MTEKSEHRIKHVNAYARHKPVVVRIEMYDKEDPETNGWIPAAPEYLVDEMAQWCKDNNCGKRTSYDMFEFPNKQAAMLFRLRWS